MTKIKYQLILMVLVVFGAFFIGILGHEAYHVIRGSPDNPKDLCISIGGQDANIILNGNEKGKALAYVINGGGSEIVALIITLVIFTILSVIGFICLRKCSNNNLKRDRRKKC